MLVLGLIAKAKWFREYMVKNRLSREELLICTGISSSGWLGLELYELRPKKLGCWNSACWWLWSSRHRGEARLILIAHGHTQLNNGGVFIARSTPVFSRYRQQH